MTKQTQDTSSPSENYLSHIFEVMTSNELFLRENARDVYSEIVGLCNDAINYLQIIFNLPQKVEEYNSRSMFIFLNHILLPLSDGIWLDTISGNLLACFSETRTILESLVKCFLADLHFPDQPSFQERLRLLEEEKTEANGEQEKISISKRMKEIGKHLGQDKDFVALWGKLSNDWVHTRGVTGRLVDQLEKTNIPAWSLVLPMNFSKDDLEILTELGERLAELRHLIRLSVDNYQEMLNIQSEVVQSDEDA